MPENRSGSSGKFRRDEIQKWIELAPQNIEAREALGIKWKTETGCIGEEDLATYADTISRAVRKHSIPARPQMPVKRVPKHVFQNLSKKLCKSS